jgi:hypothetical protein
MKKQFNIMIHTINSVKEFCEIVIGYSNVEVMVMSGRYIIDGKSIMGLFSIDITKVLSCEIEGNNPEELDEIYEKLKAKGYAE